MLALAKLNSAQIKDWWDKRYLVQQALFSWRDVLEGFTGGRGFSQDAKAAKAGERYERFRQELANNIIRSKRYEVIASWHEYYLEQLDLLISILNELRAQEHRDLGELARYEDFEQGMVENYYRLLIDVYLAITKSKQKLLVGCGQISGKSSSSNSKVSSATPLWLDIPTTWQWEYPANRLTQISVRDPDHTVAILADLLSLMTGTPPQAQLDRLLYPAPDKWTGFKDWTPVSFQRFHQELAESLGYSAGSVTEDEYAQILADTYLNQTHTLAENRPVLVRLDASPVVHQLILCRKKDKLVCRIGTHAHGDILAHMSLAITNCDSTISYLSGAFTGERNTNETLGALIATIYHDLVVVERVSTTAKKPSLTGFGKNGNALIATATSQAKPDLLTTIWKYIPQKIHAESEETNNDRQLLSEGELTRRQAIRRWHSVCGHIRRYKDKADWEASSARQELARQDGVILRPGETYVRPHDRNVPALAELGNINISEIPHYLRRSKLRG